MKIKELVQLVNKDFKDEVSIIGIAQRMGIGISNWIEQERLVSYWVGNWYCTDSYVGYKVYFMDGEPVAVSSQIGRKMEEKFEWLSKEAYEGVKSYILSFVMQEEDFFNLADMNEDIGESYKISFCSQLFDYHLKIGMYQGKTVEIIEKDKEDRYTAKKVKIKHQDGDVEWVTLEDMDFPFNIISFTALSEVNDNKK